MDKKAAKALKAARDSALAGRPEEAIAGLASLADGGSAAAAASLAEMLAFRGDWAGVARNARRLLEDPEAFYAANVFDDMVRLLGLAGHALRDWKSVAAAAAAGLAIWEGERNRKILTELAAYAARGGAPPHERIEVFGYVRAAPSADAYAAAMREHEAERGKKKPEAWAGRAFALASVYSQDAEMVRIFDGNAAHMDFEDAISAGRVLARGCELDRAWKAIEPRIAGWFPVDSAQVAPLVLITDEALRKLETRERWERVLATPRGPGAKKLRGTLMDKGKGKKERWAQVLATGRGIGAKKAGKVAKPKMKAAYKPVSKAAKKKAH